MTYIKENDGVQTPEGIELNQTNGQIPPRAFRYKVTTTTGDKFNATVIGTTNTGAKEALNTQFPNATLIADGESTHIIQINDAFVLDT